MSVVFSATPTAPHPHAAAPFAAPARLVKAAHEFEGQMLTELLKPLTRSDGLTGEDSDTNSGGALSAFASEALGQALSDRGGFGIANRIIAQLSHSGNQPATAAVTGDLHTNTGLRANK